MTERAPLTRAPRRVRLRVEDYLALDAASALERHGRTELIDGTIVHRAVGHRPHGWTTTRLLDALADRLKTRAGSLEALVGCSVSLPPHDAPAPDITITDAPHGEGLVPSCSIALIVEVADSTLRNDLSRKHRIYARAGVQEYWVADVHGRVLHQMWAPAAERYAERRAVAFGASVTAATLPDLTIDTAEL